MKALLALMRHEIAERRLVAAAGLLLGLVPLALPLLPNVPRQPAADLRGGSALILAGLLSGALALGLGSSAVGRDLGERRLGFFFARPLPGWAIWGGKMAAALALAWAAGLLVLLPVLLLGDLADAELGTTVPAGALAVFVLVALAHAVGIFLRARSAWLLLDFAGLCLFAAVAGSALNALGRAGALDALYAIALALGVALLAALCAAGLIQVARGRTDLRRGHRLLSLTLWGALLAAVLGVAGAARWVIAAPLSALEELGPVTGAPAGSWIALTGRAAHRGNYWPSFLVDLRHGTGHRVSLISGAGKWWQPPSFSADGRRAAWVESGRIGYEVVVADLADGKVERRAARPLGGMIESVTLSPRGDRLAMNGRDRVLVEDALSGRLLASVPRTRGGLAELHFLPGSDLRILEIIPGGASWELEIRDLPAAGGEAVPVRRLSGFTFEDGVGYRSLPFGHVSPDGELLQLRQGGLLRLWEIESGRELAAVPVSTAWIGAFLPGGRWAAIEGGPGEGPANGRLRVFSRDGRELRPIPLPRGVVLGPQIAPELLAVYRPSKRRDDRGASDVLLIDLRSGRVRQLEPGLAPLARPGMQPGSLPALLFLRGGSELLLLDPATGAFRPALRSGR